MVSIFDKITSSDTTSAPDLESHASANILISEIAHNHESRTRRQVREAAQELLKYGLLEESHKPNLYRTVMTNAEDISGIFEPLDLDIRIDEIRGLIYITVRQNDSEEPQDDWSHPLVRRQRLNLEQSLLVAILRQHFIAYEQERGTGEGQAQIAIDDLLPQLQVYLGDPGSESKERTRTINLLDQLKGHGLVSALDAHERFTIRPIIAHLADPINLQMLLTWLQKKLDSQSPLDSTEDLEDKENTA